MLKLLIIKSSLKLNFPCKKEKVRNETRKEKEQAIREFYLREIQRKEKETDAKEESYKIQIEKLQEQIKKKKDLVLLLFITF